MYSDQGQSIEPLQWGKKLHALCSQSLGLPCIMTEGAVSHYEPVALAMNRKEQQLETVVEWEWATRAQDICGQTSEGGLRPLRALEIMKPFLLLVSLVIAAAMNRCTALAAKDVCNWCRQRTSAYVCQGLKTVCKRTSANGILQLMGHNNTELYQFLKLISNNIFPWL